MNSFGKGVRLVRQNFEGRGVRQTSSGRQVRGRSQGPEDAEGLRGREAAVSGAAEEIV